MQSSWLIQLPIGGVGGSKKPPTETASIHNNIVTSSALLSVIRAQADTPFVAAGRHCRDLLQTRRRILIPSPDLSFMTRSAVKAGPELTSMRQQSKIHQDSNGDETDSDAIIFGVGTSHQ
jgi:hypothetical protein